MRLWVYEERRRIFKGATTPARIIFTRAPLGKPDQWLPLGEIETVVVPEWVTGELARMEE